MTQWVVLTAATMLIFGISGCAGLSQLTEQLNARQLTSCIRWHGSMRAGGIFGGQVAVEGITATGGAMLESCREDILR